MSERLNIGIEPVSDPQKGYSFRIIKNRAGGIKPEVIKGMDCPLWFHSQAAATNCAKDLIRAVANAMRQGGFKVESFQS